MNSALDNIRVVLVGTLYSGNVGSACRAMANMGIRQLVLAAPNIQIRVRILYFTAFRLYPQSQ